MASVQKKRVLFIGLSIFISFLLTTFFILNFYLKSIVEHQIETFLNANKKEFYSVHFEKLKLNWFTHTIILKSVKVSPDSMLLSKVIQDSTEKTAFYITLKSLRIRHINLWNAINHHKINNHEIVFQKPVLTYFSHLKSNTTRNPNHFEKRSSFFKWTVDNYHIKASDQFVPISGNRYKLRFKSIDIDKEKELIIVQGLQLKPIKKLHKRLSKNHFKRNLFDVEVNEMRLKELNLRGLFVDRKLFARRIDIVGARIKIANKKDSAKFKKRRPLFPNQILNRLSIPITIDTLHMVNSLLEYFALEKGSKDPLTLQFSKINAEVYHLTSVKKNHRSVAPLTVAVMPS